MIAGSSINNVTDQTNGKKGLWLCQCPIGKTWSKYRINGFSFTFGAPSMELFVDSYKEYYSKKGIEGMEDISVVSGVRVKNPYVDLNVEHGACCLPLYDTNNLYLNDYKNIWLSSPGPGQDSVWYWEYYDRADYSEYGFLSPKCDTLTYFIKWFCPVNAVYIDSAPVLELQD